MVRSFITNSLLIFPTALLRDHEGVVLVEKGRNVTLKPEIILRAKKMTFTWKDPEQNVVLSGIRTKKLKIWNLTAKQTGVYTFTGTFQPVRELDDIWEMTARITLGKESTYVSNCNIR